MTISGEVFLFFFRILIRCSRPVFIQAGSLKQNKTKKEFSLELGVVLAESTWLGTWTAAKHPVMYTAQPPAKDSLAPVVESVTAEKPLFRVNWGFFFLD